MIKFIKDNRGGFTLEASLVMPIVFITLLILMFFCMYLYQNAVLGQLTTVAAERAAFSWNDSHRASRTGGFDVRERDRLYWRIGEDGMLNAILGRDHQDAANRLQLPASADESSSLSLKKLANTAQEIPNPMEGAMVYSHSLMKRTIQAEFTRLVPLLPLERVLGQEPRQAAESVAYAVEPVEWIRSIELARYLGAKFTGSASAGFFSKEDAGKTLDLFGK
ncbi:pilus assembly protein TadE [Paenibacillus sp. CAA11]|uniref:TadE family protein n=1 Tax=Paenibacillus sp. CAA11 TaxID=1532905 RepID=UPI000D366FBA|nr:TadE family protein [Paenibacillus sp. CAA11]AWB43836.1 pilus assembly protein TadE [Paenibacillus sp. CAA11]